MLGQGGDREVNISDSEWKAKETEQIENDKSFRVIHCRLARCSRQKPTLFCSVNCKSRLMEREDIGLMEPFPQKVENVSRYFLS